MRTGRQLFDDDWGQRNQAVRTLVRFSPESHGILSAINPDSLSDHDRWWHAAAVEAIERQTPQALAACRA